MLVFDVFLGQITVLPDESFSDEKTIDAAAKESQHRIIECPDNGLPIDVEGCVEDDRDAGDLLIGFDDGVE